MHAAEIIMREVQSASRFQVRQLLRESVRKPRESPHLHPHGQVLPLDVRCAYPVRIGIAIPHLGYRLHHWAWGVALMPMLAVIAIQFNELGKVYLRSKSVLDDAAIEHEAIRC
jgi:hypothetical protein